MSVDHIAGGKLSAPALGTIAAPGAIDPGNDLTALGGPDLGNGDASAGNAGGTTSISLTSDATPPSLGALQYYAGLSKPVTISWLPSSADPVGSDDSPASLAGGSPTTVALVDDFGGGSFSLGSAAIDLFSNGAGGGPPGHGGGGGGGGSAPPQYSKTLNGITFVVNWDSSVGNAPSGFVGGVETAVDYFLNNLSSATPLTVTINVGYGEVAGQRLAFGALGESSTNIDTTSYSALSGSSLGSYLPASDPLGSTTHTYWVPTAEEKALGLTANNTAVDGSVGFSSKVSWNYTSTPTSGQYDFVSTAEHEISEVMGRIGIGGGSVGGSSNSYTPLDLLRYSAPGTISPSGSSTAYFSYDFGQSSGPANLAGSSKTYFNNVAGGDISDWASSAGNDAYDAFASSGSNYATSDVDKAVMDVLGYGKIATT